MRATIIASPNPRSVDIKTTSRVRGTPFKILKKDSYINSNLMRFSF
jgi:hypothetical protein